MDDSLKIDRSGRLVWGTTRQVFRPTKDEVSVLVSHDGTSAAPDWRERFERIGAGWSAIAPALDQAIPGGLAKATLYRVDLRPDVGSCAGILHFTTKRDRYDWYVRLDRDGRVEVVAPKD